jgi:hypothetical protein
MVMMRRFVLLLAVALGLFVPLGLLAAVPAWASGMGTMSAKAMGQMSSQEVRYVGAYRFVVGWSDEPAYVGQLNSVQLILTYRATGKPVTSLGNSFKVTITSGGQSMVSSLAPTVCPYCHLGTPGDYRAWLFPTQPGTYTFRFTGTLGTQAIDQSFTSGPMTFPAVQDPTAAEFPVQTPTMTELSAQVSSSLPHLATSAQASRAQLLGILGIVGLAVGVAGLAVALVALRRLRQA